MRFGGGLPFRGRRLVRLIVIGTFAASAVWPVVGASVTLAWNPNAESNIAGYKLYVGTNSRAYTAIIDAGNKTNQVVSNLVAGTTYYFAATAYNTSGLESDPSAEIVHAVPLGNSSPVISDIPNTNMPANSSLTIALTIGDNQTSAANLSLSGISSNTTLLPNGNIVFGGTGSNRTVTVTPAANQAGSAAITITVSDGALTANDTFVLTVNAVNTAPTISDVADQTINEDETTGTLSFTVGDGESAPGSLTITRTSSNPALLPLSNIVLGGTGTNRTVTVTPAVNQTGTATIALNVSDGQLNASDTFVVTVNAVNDMPAISDIGNQSVNANTSTPAIPFTVGDVETTGGNLIVSGTSSNQNLVADTNIVFGGGGSNRTVTVTPASNQTGTVAITITVTDGVLMSSDTFVLTVNSATNSSPTISDIAARAIQEDTGTGTIPFTIGDAESASGTLTLSKASSNTSLVPLSRIAFGGTGSNRTVRVTPATNRSGTATISVTVSDGQLSATDTFLLTVNAVNDPPTISNIADQTTESGTTVGPIPFTVRDVDTAVAGLTLSGRSSNQSLVPDTNIVFGGSGTNRTLSVTPAAGQTGTSTITVSVNDGSLTASDTLLLTVTSSMGSSNNLITVSITNAGAIGIPDVGAAAPYPSTINVSGLGGTISDVSVKLNGLQHTYAADLDVLLVSPTGQKVMIMSDAGGDYYVLSGVNLTLSDRAMVALPQSPPLVSGTYKPTDVTPGEAMLSPAPAGPYANSLAAFNGLAPNGTWSLYVVDDGPRDQGSFAGGWSLSITTTAQTSTASTLSGIVDQLPAISLLASSRQQPALLALTGTESANPKLISIQISNNIALIAWSAVPGVNYTLEYSDDPVTENWVALPSVIATGPTATATQAIAGSPRRFYRVHSTQ